MDKTNSIMFLVLALVWIPAVADIIGSLLGTYLPVLAALVLARGLVIK